MKCIICMKEISENYEICSDCNKIMDTLYNNPEEKEKALNLFREVKI